MGTLLLFFPLRPISRGGSRVLPPLPLAGLIGQIKACTENRTITGEYYVLTRYMYRLMAINGEQIAYPECIQSLLLLLCSTPYGISGSYSLTHLEAFPYPWWNAMVGSKVGYFLPVKADYYCWTNLHPQLSSRVWSDRLQSSGCRGCSLH